MKDPVDIFDPEAIYPIDGKPERKKIKKSKKLKKQKKNIRILQQGKTLAPNLSTVDHDESLLNNLVKDIKDFLDQKGNIKPNATKTLEYLNLQLEKYIGETLKIKNYKINYQEEGAIPLFCPKKEKEKNKINIGSAGGMTRLSTGYTFLNIQDHSKYIVKNIETIKGTKRRNPSYLTKDANDIKIKDIA